MWLDLAILLLFYGVYFGVITKDIADHCTDRMASTIGFFSEDGMPLKHLDKSTCGICGELNVGTDENGQPEKQMRNSFILNQRKIVFSICYRVVICSMNSV